MNNLHETIIKTTYGAFLEDPRYISDIDNNIGAYISDEKPIKISDIINRYAKIPDMFYEKGGFYIATQEESEGYIKSIQESDQIIIDVILGLLIYDIHQRLQIKTGKNEKIVVTQGEYGDFLSIMSHDQKTLLQKQDIQNHIASIFDKN